MWKKEKLSYKYQHCLRDLRALLIVSPIPTLYVSINRVVHVKVIESVFVVGSVVRIILFTAPLSSLSPTFFFSLFREKIKIFYLFYFPVDTSLKISFIFIVQ